MHNNQLTDKELRQAASSRYGSGQFILASQGVYFLGKDREGKEQPPQWLCSPLHITAMTRNEHGHEWGRLLEWQDKDGMLHAWPMPLEKLEGDGIAMRCALVNGGLLISPNRQARDLLCAYIKVWPVEARACCTDRFGWHGSVYVCADQTIGMSEERFIYQSQQATPSHMQSSGSLEGWQLDIAGPSLGNSRLMLAICAAFAGPLVRIAGEESGGFHLRGHSSIGKSTALYVAASVWGKPAGYVKSWHSTINGKEGQANQHNDGLLILDELSQADPEKVGEMAYMLANEQGKGRANIFGNMRESNQWKLLFLSAGEVSLATLMEQSRKRSTAGQEIRLADVPADAGAKLGLLEALHDFSRPENLAQALKRSAAQHHGHVGIAWLEYLTQNFEGLAGTLQAHINHFATSTTPANVCGQAQRMTRRFGLIAAAGELASRAGLTGWPEGAATQAAEKCFAAWLEGFGTGNHEDKAIIQQTLAFLETHGNSRFEAMNGGDTQRIPNRAGFYRPHADGPCEYLMTAPSFIKEICQAHDPKVVKRVLIDAAILIPAKDGKATQQARLPGLGPSKVYVLRYANHAD